MKKSYWKIAAFALAMMVTVPAFVACSSSDDNDEVSLEVNKPSFSINRLGGIIEVEVKTSGDWTAEIPEKNGETPWADVVNNTGKGNAKLQVTVDYFSPRLQKQNRSTQLIIRSGEKTQTVTLQQYIGLKEGETVSNANDTFYDLWANKGLGAGYDITTGKDAASKILNLYSISTLKDDPEIRDLITQSPNPNTKLENMELDTTMNNTVGLTVEGKLDVNWAKFKLNIEVNYSNKDLQITDVKNYHASQSIVFLTSTVDIPTTAAIMEEDETLAKKLFTRGFRGYYNRIVSAAKTNDEATFKTQVESMLSNYGPAIVAGSELGGSLFTSVRYDSLKMANNFDVKGKATAEVVLGPLEIKGGVSVGYSRKGTDFYNNTQHHVTCTGGSQQAISGLVSLLDEKLPEPTKVTEAAKTWVNSIISSNDNNDNTTVVRITPIGIWQLFPAAYQAKIKNIAIKYYEGKTTCIQVKNLQ